MSFIHCAPRACLGCAVVSWTGETTVHATISPTGWGRWSEVEDAVATAAEPLDACASLTHSVAGGILLVERGTCFFTLKVFHAQQAGAEGVLIINNDRDMPTAMNAPEDEDRVSKVNIPVLLIERLSGLRLLEAIRSDLQPRVSLFSECCPIHGAFLSLFRLHAVT